MSLRDFRNVEYYRLKDDHTWDIQKMLVPVEVPYDHCLEYIWTELVGLDLRNNLQTIAIYNFSNEIVSFSDNVEAEEVCT
jgi:hypothetical protein